VLRDVPANDGEIAIGKFEDVRTAPAPRTGLRDAPVDSKSANEHVRYMTRVI
jgi:hypothetical protein